MICKKEIWIYAETESQKIAPSYYELLGKAHELKESLNESYEIVAVVLSDSAEEVSKELRGSAADRVYCLEHEKLGNYNPEYYAAVLSEFAKKHKPEMLWIAASAIGGELAPSVAALLNTGLAAHCVDILINDKGELVHLVPAFGGKLLTEILVPKTRPIMASVKPGIFREREIACSKEAEFVFERAEILDSMESRFKLVEEQEMQSSGLPVEKAEVVLAGGRGIGNPQTWEKLKELAGRLDGAVGYTRSLVDIGLEENEVNMIGSSGKSVRPKLYMGFGISGASHHISGIKDSGTIIAVNTDDEADIFDSSDYKIVADCDRILSALLEVL